MVYLSVGYGHTCGCLHPWNLLLLRDVCRCCRVFESFELCFYVRLCCVNYGLEVLCGRRSSVFACHAVDGFDAISRCAHHFVRVCDGGIGDVFVLELHSVD
jgi:hypothetical protein